MLAAAEPADLDDGPRTARSGAARMCAVTRQVRPVDELIRFVAAPTGEVVADLKRKLPGRGLWLSASRPAVEEAVRRKLFGRGFRREVRVPPTLADDLDHLLVTSAVEALAMAGKAGQAVAGFEKVKDALAAHQAAALIHAREAAIDGIRKLDAAARQFTGDAGETDGIPVISALASADLDLALGRSNVIHAAVLAGPAGKTFLSRSLLLVRYRAAGDGKQAARHHLDRDTAR
jgi:predicted RNA-binding protein YlxR (DUF448 family)